MAKLSVRIKEKLERERMEVARRENDKLFKEACRASGYTKVPDEISALFEKSKLPRLNAVVFTNYTKAI